MKRWLRCWLRFLFGRCPVCELRWCPVYGAYGNQPPVSPAVFVMHRGAQW
jgi:hypothetical protein